jgi:hypothetical protein
MTCEWCWRKAAERASIRGGAVVDHYNVILQEQDKYPTCPYAVGAASTADAQERE